MIYCCKVEPLWVFSFQRMGAGHKKEEGLPKQCPQWPSRDMCSAHLPRPRARCITDLQQSPATDLSLNNINSPTWFRSPVYLLSPANKMLPSLFSTQLTIYYFQFPKNPMHLNSPILVFPHVHSNLGFPSNLRRICWKLKINWCQLYSIIINISQ